MATNIIVRTWQVQDFVSVDAGDKEVSLTLFKGQVQAGTPGWCNTMAMKPEQARDLANELLAKIDEIQKRTPQETEKE
jgi:hypothetical protein